LSLLPDEEALILRILPEQSRFLEHVITIRPLRSSKTTCRGLSIVDTHTLDYLTSTWLQIEVYTCFFFKCTCVLYDEVCWWKKNQECIV